MKKTVKVVGVILILVLSLSSCGDSESEESITYGEGNSATADVIDPIDSNEEPEETEMSEDEIYALLMNNTNASPVSITDITTEEDNVGYIYPVTRISYNATNNMEVDIRKCTLGIVAWDDNGLPISLGEDNEIAPEYKYVTQRNIKNLAAGAGASSYTCELDNQGFRYINIILLKYEDFEGNIWENPLKDYIVSMSEKPVDEDTWAYEIQAQ